MSRIVAAALLLAAAACALPMVTGVAHLETPLPGGLPLGNLLTALVLCATAGAAVALVPPHTRLRTAAKLSLLAAVAWLPLSIALAGNLALNFTGGRGTAWLVLSLAIVVVVLVTLAWALLANFAAALRELRLRNR